jgi:HSP90 family molecular chaperone
MYLSPIIGAASQVLSLFSSNKASSSPAPSSPDPLSIVDSNGKVDLSQAAQVFSKLQDLSQSDPAKFKQITANISSQLKAEADQSTGAAQTFLSNLAGKFQTASQTGSTSALHHGHGHHSAPTQSAYQLAAQTTDAQATAESTVQSVLQQL